MWHTIIGQLRTSARLQFGLGLLGLLVVLAIVHPLASGVVGSQDAGGDPLAIAAYRPWLMPTGSHWLGTDRYGRDILVMSLTGLSASLQVGLIAGLISTAIGVIVAFVGGYKGGAWDSTLRTVTDMFLVIPSLPLLLVLSAYVRRVSLAQVGVMITDCP